jgi:hypothetical protein
MWEKVINLKENLFDQLLEIYIGYKNLILYKLNRFDEEDTLEYKRKKKICTKDCPLHSSFFGIGYCDPMKEHDGERGCGCIEEAKLWSDSPCPLNRF